MPPLVTPLTLFNCDQFACFNVELLLFNDLPFMVIVSAQGFAFGDAL